MPEQCVVEFKSNGSQGGDGEHGGYATLEFKENGAETGIQLDIRLTTGQEYKLNDVELISLTVKGDWELEGLATALMDIGRKLLQRDDILEDYLKWQKTE
jgi:hypothetical protein